MNYELKVILPPESTTSPYFIFTFPLVWRELDLDFVLKQLPPPCARPALRLGAGCRADADGTYNQSRGLASVDSLPSRPVFSLFCSRLRLLLSSAPGSAFFSLLFPVPSPRPISNGIRPAPNLVQHVLCACPVLSVTPA